MGILSNYIGMGIARAGETLGQNMMAERQRENERAARMAERREMEEQRQQDRLELQRERTTATAAANTPREIPDDVLAGEMGITIPQLEALRNQQKTGDATGLEGMDADTIAAKQKTMSRLRQMALFGKDYDDAMKGQQTGQAMDITGGVIGGKLNRDTAAGAVAAGKGEATYDNGGAGSTFDKFSGKSQINAIGQSEIRENNAQAGKAGAEAGKAKAETGGTDSTGRPTNLREATNLVNSRRLALREAQDTAIKLLLPDNFESKNLTADQRRELINKDPQVAKALADYNEAVTWESGLRGSKKDTDKAPAKGDNKQANAAMPAPQSKAEFDRLPKGARYKAPDGTIRIKQ